MSPVRSPRVKKQKPPRRHRPRLGALRAGARRLSALLLEVLKDKRLTASLGVTVRRIVALAVVLWATGQPGEQKQVEGSKVELVSGPPEAGEATDMRRDSQAPSRVVLSFNPKKPMGPDNPWTAGQKPAPCTPALEVEAFRLCWLPHGAPLGPGRKECPPQTFTHGERCLYPVTLVPRVPTSIDGGTAE